MGPASTGRRAPTPTEVAMDRALELARRGPDRDDNPRVGCVLLGPDGQVIAEGWHRGAGTPHAEAAALAAARDAGADTEGATAVVTLEPCHHTGRTPPCSRALIEAGVARVVIGMRDPHLAASGGAAYLRAQGVEVVEGVRAEAAEDLVRIWATRVRHGRPFVTLKLAASLDGRVAAADGSSRWITSADARAHAHSLRARVDAIAVGTGTVLRDDPALTARTPDGALAPHQPVRVVVGYRDVPATSRLRTAGGPLVQVRSHDVTDVLETLTRAGVRHLLVEGGPTLASAFLRAGAVDEVHAYLAPVLLGSGPTAVQDLGTTSIEQALRLTPREVRHLGPDVLVIASHADGPARSESVRRAPISQEA